MKRISLFIIPLVLLLALAPLPSAASGSGGGGGEGGDRDRGTEDFKSSKAVATFFSTYLISGGNIVMAAKDATRFYGDPRQESWAKTSQRLFVESVVAQRARRNAERQAQEAEYNKRAENISDDDLPGFGPD